MSEQQQTDAGAVKLAIVADIISETGSPEVTVEHAEELLTQRYWQYADAGDEHSAAVVWNAWNEVKPYFIQMAQQGQIAIDMLISEREMTLEVTEQRDTAIHMASTAIGEHEKLITALDKGDTSNPVVARAFASMKALIHGDAGDNEMPDECIACDLMERLGEINHDDAEAVMMCLLSDELSFMPAASARNLERMLITFIKQFAAEYQKAQAEIGAEAS